MKVMTMTSLWPMQAMVRISAGRVSIVPGSEGAAEKQQKMKSRFWIRGSDAKQVEVKGLDKMRDEMTSEHARDEGIESWRGGCRPGKE